MKSVFPGLVSMNPATACAFVLASLGIFLFPRPFPQNVVSSVCAGLLILIGSICILGYFGVVGFAIDRVLFGPKLGTNVMAPNTAINFVLIGTGLLFAGSGRSRVQSLSSAALTAAALVALLAIIGYAYGLTALYKVKFYIPMAVNTALAFLMTAIGVMCLTPSSGFFGLLTRHGPGGHMARRLFPATILVPALFGGASLVAERNGIYTSEFGLMLMVVFTILIFNWLIYGAARQVDRSDKAMRQSDEALRRANVDLELAVRKRTEELRAAEQQLVQQERLRALGQMASGIAHDFNNALSPILGYSELILGDPATLDNKDLLKDHIGLINTAAKDAAGVVRRLREFSRPRAQGEVLASINLNALVRQVLPLTQPKWKTQAQAQGVDIDIELSMGHVPDVRGDESQIRELLTNLIFNAVDAMPKGGVIRLSTGTVSGRALLEVTDTGTGMSEEVRRRCLEPFFSTKGERGTGLGLSMVYGIIQRHEGTIDIDSEPGKGTTFRITFPALQGEIEAGSQDFAPTKTRKLRILYAEDEEPVRAVYVRYFELDGHLVDAVSSGREALKRYDREMYDVVVTDHAMPGMSGEEFAAELKRRAPDRPVILLSGTFDAEMAPNTSQKLDAILKKPVTLEDIRRTFARLFPSH